MPLKVIETRLQGARAPAIAGNSAPRADRNCERRRIGALQEEARRLLALAGLGAIADHQLTHPARCLGAPRR